MTLTAADLNRNHLGKGVHVKLGYGSITDVLSAVSHVADIIESRRFFDETPEADLGRISTTLRFLNAGEVQIKGSDPVEIVDLTP